MKFRKRISALLAFRVGAKKISVREMYQRDEKFMNQTISPALINKGLERQWKRLNDRSFQLKELKEHFNVGRKL